MRIGLVAVGAALALVGTAVLAVALYPTSSPELARSSLADVDGLTAGSQRTFVISAAESGSAVVSLNWTAANAGSYDAVVINVSLYQAYTCPPRTAPCISVPALVSWNGSGVGKWKSTGWAAPLYLIVVDVIGAGNPHLSLLSVDFSAVFSENYRAGPQPLPMTSIAFMLAGGGLLTAIGGIALYLGLFLPGGVYARRDEPPIDVRPGTEMTEETEPYWPGPPN